MHTNQMKQAFVHAVSSQETFDIKAGMPPLTPVFVGLDLEREAVCV